MRKSTKNIQELGIGFFETRTVESFNTLYSVLKPKLDYFIIKKFYGNTILEYTDLEDCISDALSNIYINIDQYNSYYRFSTWAYNIAKNEVFRKLNKLKSLKEIPISGINSEFIDSKGNTTPYDLCEEYLRQSFLSVDPSIINDIVNNNSYEVEIHNQEIRSFMVVIIKEIRKLEDRYRKVVWDREILKLSYIQISEKNNLNINTCKVYIHKGRQILKRRLKKAYNEWKHS